MTLNFDKLRTLNSRKKFQNKCNIYSPIYKYKQWCSIEPFSPTLFISLIRFLINIYLVPQIMIARNQCSPCRTCMATSYTATICFLRTSDYHIYSPKIHNEKLWVKSHTTSSMLCTDTISIIFNRRIPKNILWINSHCFKGAAWSSG